MILQIFDKDIFEVLTVFSISPGSRLLRKDLKEKTKLNNVNLDNALNILLNSGLLQKDRRFLSLKLDNAKPIISLVSNEYKELRELPLDAYFSIINLLYFLSKLKKINVYLFGSYAKLVFREKSDIDIAVISDKIEESDKKDIGSLIEKLEERYGKNIETHYFSANFHKNKKDQLVKEILKNGIKLI